MKKFAPFVVLILGIIVLVAAYFLVVRKPSQDENGLAEEETALIDVTFLDRPFVSLTPRPDGHYLDLKIEKLFHQASTIDYEFIYKLSDGGVQGAQGSIPLEGKEVIDIELLLGTESSGKFRYDEGVEEGTLTLRYRDEKGRLLTRFASDFHMQKDPSEISSLDGKFRLETDNADGFFITMNTIGVPGTIDSSSEVPYGVFTSESVSSGKVSIEGANEIYYWNGNDWGLLEDNKASDVGIFIAK